MIISSMAVMVPIVLVISRKVTGGWGEAVLFAIRMAVGLGLEMLPAIVKANFAEGTVAIMAFGFVLPHILPIASLLEFIHPK